MNAHMHYPAHAGMESTAGEANFYHWLITRSRARRRPSPVPAHLYADLGLDRPARQRDWSGWRPFG